MKAAMVTVLKAINPFIDESVYSSAADDILDFETAIAKVCVAIMQVLNLIEGLCCYFLLAVYKLFVQAK